MKLFRLSLQNGCVTDMTNCVSTVFVTCTNAKQPAIHVNAYPVILFLNHKRVKNTQNCQVTELVRLQKLGWS
jgi:hypothetical protein